MTENHRQCNAVWPPDDGRKDARNMLRNNWLPIKSLTVASSWSRLYLLFNNLRVSHLHRVSTYLLRPCHMSTTFHCRNHFIISTIICGTKYINLHFAICQRHQKVALHYQHLLHQRHYCLSHLCTSHDRSVSIIHDRKLKVTYAG